MRLLAPVVIAAAVCGLALSCTRSRPAHRVTFVSTQPIESTSGDLAALEIRLSGHSEHHPIELRVRERDRIVPLFTTPIGDHAVVGVERIPDGQYTLSAEIGDWVSGRLLTLASAEVDLAPDSRVEVSLALAPVPAFQRATLSGVLVVPAGWRHDGVALTASLLGVQLTDPPFQREVQVEAVETHASFETYAWHLDDVQTGAYAISCENPPVVFQVGLHPGGTSGVRMEMGAPTDLRVRVLDSLTHANVDVQAVQWNRVAPADETSTRSGARLQALGAGVYLGQCTIGEIDVSALSLDFESYERGTRRIVTHAGTNEVTLLLTKNTRIALTFRDGQTPLVDQPASVDMRQVDGDGRVMGWSRRNTSPTWKAMVDKPGRYRIRLLEPPPGFLMPAEQVVDIERGTLTDVVIQLTRKP